MAQQKENGKRLVYVEEYLMILGGPSALSKENLKHELIWMGAD